MAGQPPDPSYQPSGQDQARTQGRPAWQPDYPPAQPGQQPGAQYPGAQQPAQTYQQPAQGYQDYQAYQAPGYEQYAGTQAAGTRAARTRSQTEKGFFGSLFDFSFSSFVTPKLIRVLYALIVLWVTISAIGIVLFFYHFGGWGAAIPALIIVDPIFVLLSLCTYRVVLEAFMVVFRLYEETRKIRENSEPKA